MTSSKNNKEEAFKMIKDSRNIDDCLDILSGLDKEISDKDIIFEEGANHMDADVPKKKDIDLNHIIECIESLKNLTSEESMNKIRDSLTESIKSSIDDSDKSAFWSYYSSGKLRDRSEEAHNKIDGITRNIESITTENQLRSHILSLVARDIKSRHTQMDFKIFLCIKYMYNQR